MGMCLHRTASIKTTITITKRQTRDRKRRLTYNYLNHAG